MSREQQLRDQFEKASPALDAWGAFVTAKVGAAVQAKLKSLGDRRSLDEFFKVTPKYRVKGVGSFLAKALHRGKKYQDPLTEMTDLVGTRFVVLLRTEIKLVNDVIEQCADWHAEKARDFERDRVIKPHYFEYESTHYIVRSAHARELSGVYVPGNLPCEIQVRTLLQHAYAELSHDRVYKPETLVSDDVRRMVARGSALLETTDQVFCEISDNLEKTLADQRNAHAAATAACRKAGITILSDEHQVSFQLLRSYPSFTQQMTADSFTELVRRRDYIPKQFSAHQEDSVLFTHPVGLIAYWLADRLGPEVRNAWPFDLNLLEQIAADLGISIYG